jgi:hypothetical protein
VHTLLNVTKAKVCVNMVVERSFPIKARGMIIVERRSCGRNANDEIGRRFFRDEDEERYNVR